MEIEVLEKIKSELMSSEFGYSITDISVSDAPEGKILLNDVSIDSLPPLVRIQITSKPGPCSNVRIEIWLPYKEHWNGRFMGLGNGGLAGYIRYEMLSEYIRGGFAVANTDMGTSGGKLCGYQNTDVVKDFGWRSTHVMTVLGKTAASAFYGNNDFYSYFFGNSTGGQQAFSEATRFPYDYNGIFAGVPAFDRTGVHTYFIWNFVKLHYSDGSSVFTNDQIIEINRSATEFFFKNGYIPENQEYIPNPYPYSGVIEDFVEYLSQKFDWMNSEKASRLISIYKGPVNSETGEQIYCGMPIGAELNDGGMRTFNGSDCPNNYPFFWAFGPDFDILKFKFGKDYEIYNDLLSPDANALVDDFSEFIKAGGKILSVSGSEDPWVPYIESYKLYNKTAEKLGAETVKSFLKIYMLPGRAHHGGRGAPNLFKDRTYTCDGVGMLVEWAEKGIEPFGAVAAGKQIDGKYTIEHDVFPYYEN